jgi:hypothetical protein
VRFWVGTIFLVAVFDTSKYFLVLCVFLARWDHGNEFFVERWTTVRRRRIC